VAIRARFVRFEAASERIYRQCLVLGGTEEMSVDFAIETLKERLSWLQALDRIKQPGSKRGVIWLEKRTAEVKEGIKVLEKHRDSREKPTEEVIDFT
jgi:hypothetical protein